jgi:hypothetical protein
LKYQPSPSALIEKDAEPEESGLLVSAEIDPDSAVVVVGVGDLDRIAEPGLEVCFGIEAEPERDASIPAAGLVGHVLLARIVDRLLVLLLEFKRAAEAPPSRRERNIRIAKTWPRVLSLLVGGRRVEAPVAKREVGIDTLVEGRVERKRLGELLHAVRPHGSHRDAQRRRQPKHSLHGDLPFYVLFSDNHYGTKTQRNAKASAERR